MYLPFLTVWSITDLVDFNCRIDHQVAAAASSSATADYCRKVDIKNSNSCYHVVFLSTTMQYSKTQYSLLKGFSTTAGTSINMLVIVQLFMFFDNVLLLSLQMVAMATCHPGYDRFGLSLWDRYISLWPSLYFNNHDMMGSMCSLLCVVCIECSEKHLFFVSKKKICNFFCKAFF